MRKREKKKKRRKKPVKVPASLHSALVGMQREVKKRQGVEPSLGDLVEQAFEEDPVMSDFLEKERKQDQDNSWDDDFMKL